MARDRGAISLGDDHRVLVSQRLRRSEASERWLIAFAGRPILGPQCGEPAPAPENLRWHRAKRFRGPERRV